MYKNVMHVRICCFSNLNLLLFLPFSLPSLSSLLKLSIVVIQKFCNRGNMAAFFFFIIRGRPLSTASTLTPYHPYVFAPQDTITNVKDNKKSRPLYDVPYMFEAREFLRKKLIGKKVKAFLKQ